MKNLILIFLLALSCFAQEAEEDFVIRTTTNLVVINVDARDRDGSLIEGLTAQDFELNEDGERQTISVFEYQQISDEAQEPEIVEPPTQSRSDYIMPSTEGRIRYKDKRLLVLYFDFASMEPAEQVRAQSAAVKFLDENMTASDLISIMAYSNRLQVLQDFTGDRELLQSVVDGFRVGETSELAAEAETSEETSVDTGAAFTADETEFNIFNTDQKLSALESAVRMLTSLPEKKALVYFSSGVSQTGTENLSQLRSTVNAAVRANVSFYPIDARGLVAQAPAGAASEGSARGSQTYSGGAQRQRRARFNNQQDTLHTLASDTGGKAFLDSNDLLLGIVEARNDVSSYYILGYYSSNSESDGRYRRIEVRLPAHRRTKLDYRSGYFAPKDFSRFTSTDKERQLEEALLLGDPVTDLTLALEVNRFRLDADRYFIPIAVKIPGSEFELARKAGGEETQLDFLAQIRSGGRLISSLRDNIKVKLRGSAAEELSDRLLQYDAGFTLPSGSYSLKFLARENETGKMGSFETQFAVPDIGEQKDYARISSVVGSNQRQEVGDAVGAVKKDKKLLAKHPLIHDGVKLIPSITRVFRQDQKLYAYLELYDPESAPDKSVSISAQVAFYRAGIKAFESEPLRVAATDKDRSRTAPIEFEVALADLPPGEYICQVSVIDELGRKFAFDRARIILLPSKQAARPLPNI